MSHSSWVSKATDSLILRASVINAMRRALLASAVAASFAFVSHEASAQQQKADAAADSEVLQEVVVTGSMIKRPNAETAEAVTILKADALKDQGITNVEQALDTLTSSNPSVNIAPAVGTFTGGGTYADLRGLGSWPHPGAARWPTAGPQCLRCGQAGRPERYSVLGHRQHRGASGRRLGAVRLGRDRGRDQLHHQEELPGRRSPGQFRPPAESRRRLGPGGFHLRTRGPGERRL